MRKKILILLFIPLFMVAQKKKKATTNQQNKGQFVVLPNVGYSPETSLLLGFALFYNKKWGSVSENNKASSHRFYGSYSLKKQLNIGAKSDNWFNNNKNHLNFSLSYNNYPYLFYPNSNNEHEVYTSNYYDGQITFERLVSNNLYAGLQVIGRFESMEEVEKDKVLATKTVIGSEGFNLLGIAPSVTYDSRDNILYPTKGMFHQLKFRHYNKALSNQSTFNIFDLDLRKYTTINKYKHILALNLLYQTTDNLNIPFQLLPSVGNDKIQRGYYERRYRGKNRIVFRTDYRFPISKKFKGVLFGSVSNVQNSFGKLFSTKPNPAIGIGARYKLGDSGMHIRVDFAYGNKLSPYINVNEAF